MTLSQIMTLALRQLDEDPQDISEYDELFHAYANEGCQIAVGEYVRPKAEREVRSDENGDIHLDGDVRRVISLSRRVSGCRGEDTAFELSPIGDVVRVGYKEKVFDMICEVRPARMTVGTDVPSMLPEYAHAALADYICYRHLSNGNMAKQARAQFYRDAFYQAMQRIRPQGMGSVTTYKNLYTATDVR